MTSDRTDPSEDQPQRPTNEDPAAWHAYWQVLGQPWRTEPEIDDKRKDELRRRRALAADSDRDEPPFQGMKLSHGDIEWLLATHEDGRGPVDLWEEDRQGLEWKKQDRQGLDLRNTNLAKVDLSYLPLAAAYLKDADLQRAHLEGTDLTRARLEGTNFLFAWLKGANLQEAHLEGANLQRVVLWGKKVDATDLNNPYGGWVQLCNRERKIIEGVDRTEDFLEMLLLTDLRGPFFVIGTVLSDIIPGDKEYGSPKLADLHWNGANLAVVNWEFVDKLGDEHYAKDRWDYMAAVRANRQLAVALREQGLNEVADRFFYHSQVLRRKVFRLWRQRKEYLFSLFSWVLAGYGYRPWWTLGWYVGVVLVCGVLYYMAGVTDPDPEHQLSVLEAFTTSVIAFHGRGVFASSLNDMQSVIAAVQAFLGLGIEIAFIVTFTQRFFGK